METKSWNKFGARKVVAHPGNFYKEPGFKGLG